MRAMGIGNFQEGIPRVIGLQRKTNCQTASIFRFYWKFSDYFYVGLKEFHNRLVYYTRQFKRFKILL